MSSTQETTNYESTIPERYLPKPITLVKFLEFITNYAVLGLLFLGLGSLFNQNYFSQGLILTGGALFVASVITTGIKIHDLAYKYDKPT